MDRFAWALHFVQAHKQAKGAPSFQELVTYPKAFNKISEEHAHLHLQFYTGHEHDPVTGTVLPGRVK
jgi:hypothetical protein